VKVLVACECSGVVRRAFRKLGYNAWSNDIKPAEDGSPFHFIGDAREVIRRYEWDLVISHAVCKYLANSGNKHLYVDGRKENGVYEPRWEDMRKGAQFYADLWNAPVPFMAAENPVWHGHAAKEIQERCTIPHPLKRQFVQPWWFGHMEMKATGLALRNLPELEQTNNVYDEMMLLPYKERAKVHNEKPGPDREANRSRTLVGLADAMAFQWGHYVATQLLLR